MSQSRSFLLHNFSVRTDLPLNERTVPSQTLADFHVTVEGPGITGPDVTNSTLLAELVVEQRRWYSVLGTSEGVLVMFPELADFAIHPDLSTIHCHPRGSTDPAALALLLKGTVMSACLNLRGLTVLHASAVELNNRAVLFAGLSGMGKSTCAALACAAGFRLVADDAVVVQPGEPTMVSPGSSHLRLRSQASSVLELFETQPTVWETVDKRIAVRPEVSTKSLPIRAIVIPRPSQRHDKLVVERRRPSASIPLLTALQRIPGWRDRAITRRQFRRLAEVANRVPVLDAIIPWGPPFTTEPMSRLLEMLQDG